MTRTSSFTHLLSWRATHQPDQVGYVFIADGVAKSNTYLDLDRWARTIALRLRQAGVKAGDRALLLHPPGAEFLAALFGCLYAGVVAVPVVPPDPARLDRTLPRLQTTIADAIPAVVLAPTALRTIAMGLTRGKATLQGARWVATDTIPTGEPDECDLSRCGVDDLALLQYTSGSTGTPKGVMLTHGNLLHNSRLIHDLFGTTEESRALSWLPPYHDMGLIGGLLQPLFAGFPVWLMSPLDFLRRPVTWLEEMSRLGVTMSGGPNFAYDLCVRKTTPEQRERMDLSSWRVAFNGAEPVRDSTLTRFAEAFAPAGFRAEAFLPCYGLAEATLMVSGGSAQSTAGYVDRAALERGDVRPAQGDGVARLISSGRCAPDQTVVVVDPLTLHTSAPNQIGEVWLQGPSVAAGYWGRPEESRAVFRARLADGDEAEYLRTGDLGFIRAGEIVVTGRLNDLIVIRGRNHYPQDLEATAEQAHHVLRLGGAAVFQMEQEGQCRLVCVHEVNRDAQNLNVVEVARAIRHHIAEKHGLRVDVVVLVSSGELPKTTSGKVQRDACRRQLLSGRLTEIGHSDNAASPHDEPNETTVPTRSALLDSSMQQRTGQLETYLRERTAAACGVSLEEVAPNVPLLAAGLDSLGAQQLRQWVESDFGVNLPLAKVLSGISPAEMAVHLANELTAADPASKPSTTPPPPLPPNESRLTAGQRALWFLQQLAPQSAAHTTAAAFRLNGTLNVPALRRAFDQVVSRHPALRATFMSDDGEPRRVVDIDRRGQFTVVDVTNWTEVTVAALLTSDANQPFDLDVGPLVRLHLYRRTANEHLVLVTSHHLVMDFWSAAILGRELTASYAGQTGGPVAPLRTPSASIADVVAWQDTMVDGPGGSDLMSYWREQIGIGLPRVDLGVAEQSTTPATGPARHFKLDPVLLEQLRRLAATENVTLYVLLLAGYLALLHRLTGQHDVAVGTPAAGRTRPGFDEIVDYLMNPLPIRSCINDTTTFRQLLQQTRTRVIGALEHQDLPGATLAHERTAGPDGYFSTMFVFNRLGSVDAGGFPAALLGLPGVRRPFADLMAETIPVDLHESAFDVELTLSEIDGAVHGVFRYRTNLFDSTTADQFLHQLTTLLELATTAPDTKVGSLVRIQETERDRILKDWNATGQNYAADACVPELVKEQARRTPDATAVQSADQSLSYRELEEASDRLAQVLRDTGIRPGDRVGVCVDRHPGAIVALLAVLTVGGAYVPVDPASPPQRISSIFTDAGVAAILTDQALATKVTDAGLPVVLVNADADPTRRPRTTSAPSAAIPHAAAYVVYTSGSTGRPKGVVVPHQALTNHTLYAADRYGIGPGDRVLQFASLGFDASAEEIYPTLTRGACLVLRVDRALADPATFLQWCALHEITVLDLSTAFWHDLVDALEQGLAALPAMLRLVIIGGESASLARVTAWRRLVGTTVRLVNTYGPTEATVVATDDELGGTGPLPRVAIGRPVANVRAYVLDHECQPLPPGVVGELHLAGAGLAFGYLHRPGLTAERFVADPFGQQGERLYRTGDLARYLPNGSLEFVGRVDRQVKLNGYRVELEEIEWALRRSPGIRDAVVVPDGEHGQLVAYVTRNGHPSVTVKQIRAALRTLLPGYMVPSRYLVLSALPRTASGKIDYSELPAPNTLGAGGEPESPGELPASSEERALAKIWCEVLKVPQVYREDDFFALGGHSLLATKMVARLTDSLDVDLPLRAVFEAPTLTSLADRIREAPKAVSSPVRLAARDRPLPLSFIQEGIWFLQRLAPNSASYNVPRALRIRGALDAGAVRRTFAALEVRHEILRTTFPDVDGDPVQRLHGPKGIPVDIVDQRSLPEVERDAWIRTRILAAGREPFDLTTGPLLRVTLVHLADDEYVLIVVEHHLIHDGWAQGVFLRDFLEIYEADVTGRASRLPVLTVQYADFAVWQRRMISGERLETLLNYWGRRLDGAPPVLRLPTDRPRPRVLGTSGGEETLTIDTALARGLRELGHEHDATLFMTMFATFLVLLHGQSRQDDIVVGAGLANRQRPELENMLGMIVNTVLLRTDVSGDPSFAELLGRARGGCLEAYAHQDLPFEKLVTHLRPARDLGHMPLFQVMFSFLDTPMPSLRLPGMNLEVLAAHNFSAKFDLNAIVIPHSEQRLGGDAVDEGGPGETIAVQLEYNADLFDPGTIREMLRHYELLLRSVVAAPEQSVGALVGQLALSGSHPRTGETRS